MLTINEVKDFLDPNMEQLTYNALAAARPMWKMVAGERDTVRFNSAFSEMSGLTPVDQAGLYDSPGEKKPVQGYDQSQTQKKWPLEVIIPEATWRFATSSQELLRQYEDSGEAAAMVRPFNARLDKLVAAKFISAETLTGKDGVYLASASHPRPNSASVWSNYLNSGAASVLSETNVEAMLALINQCPDLVGEPAELLTYNTAMLMVQPEQQSIALRILKSIGLQGTPNNDMNPITQMGLSGSPIVWTRLSSSFDGANIVDWWVVFKGLLVKIIWSVKPEFKSYIDRNDNYHFAGKAWFDVIDDEPRGIFFADGA